MWKLAWLNALIGAVTIHASLAAEQVADNVVRVEAHDMRSLEDSLLSVAEVRLRSIGLIVDRQRAWMSLSSSPPMAQLFEVRPLWSADTDAPLLPLAFELRPLYRGGLSASELASARTFQATLAVSVLREVAVATRRLHKGSAVTCADLTVQRRRMRDVPPSFLSPRCDVGLEAVALRDVAAGDLLRSGDIGKAPDVVAGASVRVSVAIEGVSVATTAIALADAKVGDRIDVRLQHPIRTLRTRVTGPGLVQLTDESL